MRLALWFLLLTMPVAIGQAAERHDDAALGAINAFLQGRFDNDAQVAKAGNGTEPAIPEVRVVIEAVAQKHWALWHVHLATDAETSYDQTWAMETRFEHDGSGALIPHYQVKQNAVPTAASFNPVDWLSLEACAYRGAFSSTHVEGMAEGEPCVAVSMGVGARRALLPVSIDRKGQRLQIDLNLRGVRTHIEMKRSP